MVAYFNGRYLPKEEIAVSPDDRGFLFGDGLYEVVRSYEGRLFKLQDHLARLSYGAKALSLNITDFNYLADVAQNLIRENNLTQDTAVVYVQVTRGAAVRTHAFPPHDIPLTVYAAASRFDGVKQRKQSETGVDAILVPDQRWARCDIKTIGLTANVLANQKAKESSAAEALFVKDGVVLEGSHSNFFAILESVVCTHPKTNSILGGITRQAVIDICRSLSIPICETPVFEADILRAEELLIAGTTVEITPVVRIDGKLIEDGQPGPITRRLQQVFLEMVGS